MLQALVISFNWMWSKSLPIIVIVLESNFVLFSITYLFCLQIEVIDCLNSVYFIGEICYFEYRRQCFFICSEWFFSIFLILGK
jgi:hypothetical protein